MEAHLCGMTADEIQELQNECESLREKLASANERIACFEKACNHLIDATEKDDKRLYRRGFLGIKILLGRQ